METGGVGKLYQDGEVIVRQGEVGNCMYVIQSGKAEVVEERNEQTVPLAALGENDFFGEMAIFENRVRSATVRALGAVRVLTVDKKTLLRRIQQDPALAFHFLERICNRIRKLDCELARAKTGT